MHHNVTPCKPTDMLGRLLAQKAPASDGCIRTYITRHLLMTRENLQNGNQVSVIERHVVMAADIKTVTVT